ncbi:MAG: hypothetical protein ACXVRG_13170, partial [Gaiellaceae bacterium]
MAQPRKARFRDPAAEAVWAGIETLDVALQHELLLRLGAFFERAALNPTTGRSKAATAVAALHRAA